MTAKGTRFDPTPFTKEEKHASCRCKNKRTKKDKEQPFYAHENYCPVYMYEKSDHP